MPEASRNIVLEDKFQEILEKYSAEQETIRQLWASVTQAYGQPYRHYHNFTHLDQMAQALEAVSGKLHCPDAVWLALFYHDIVYDPQRKDNEIKSAETAIGALSSAAVTKEVIDFCEELILATAKHEVSTQHDINYFTDADLSILGQPEEAYNCYADKVRKEYAVYADEVYFPARANVLHHFLDMHRIYKTDFFADLYELSARQNMQQELQSLQIYQ